MQSLLDTNAAINEVQNLINRRAKVGEDFVLELGLACERKVEHRSSVLVLRADVLSKLHNLSERAGIVG
jgi:hypothetical protein